MTVGRLYRSKGLHVLLEALAMVRGQVPDVVLDVVGGASGVGSPVLRELAAQARELGVAGAVTFHGHLREPWRLASRAGVYVQASTGEETQGLALREALLIGMPVVATDLPAWRDVSDDALRRVPPRDPQALADAIVTTLLAPTGPATDARHPDSHVADEDLVSRIAAIYRQLLHS